MMEGQAQLTPRDYVLIFDGGSRGNPGVGYGSYLLIRMKDGKQELKRIKFQSVVTNNEAEYGTLLAGLLELYRLITAEGDNPRGFTLRILGDSALVINQLSGRWKVRDPRMRDLNDKARNALSEFRAWDAVLQPREESVRLLGH